MAKDITEDDLLQELADQFYIPALQDDDVTATRVSDAIVAKGGVSSPKEIEKQLMAKVKAGELTMTRKKASNGKITTVFEKV